MNLERLECPICQLSFIQSRSCTQCLKSICQTCYQHIIQSSVLQKACPFCRKPYVDDTARDTAHNTARDTGFSSEQFLTLLQQVALNYLLDEPVEPTQLVQPTRTAQLAQPDSFSDSIRWGYLIGTGIYFFRQIFNTR